MIKINKINKEIVEEYKMQKFICTYIFILNI